MKIGYAHVSTEDQNLRMRAGVSGYGVRSQFEPEGAGGCSNACAAGDVLTAWKLERPGRSLLDLVGLAASLPCRAPEDFRQGNFDVVLLSHASAMEAAVDLTIRGNHGGQYRH